MTFKLTPEQAKRKMSNLTYIRPDMSTMPADTERVTVRAVVERSLVRGWLEEVGETPWRLITEEVSEFHFDAGGIALRDEPSLELVIDSWKFSVFVRHADVLHDQCRRVMTHLAKVGLHVWLPGYWTKAVLSVETGEKIAAWLDQEAYEEQADSLWEQHLGTMRGAGVIVPPRVERRNS